MRDPIYLCLSPDDPLEQPGQSEPARFLLIAEETTSQQYKESIAKALVRGNCLYFLAWGSESEAWHDAVDAANYELFESKSIPDERLIVTTWHDDEPLSEVFLFAKKNAFHPEVELQRTVLLHVSHVPQERKFLGEYAAA